MVYGSEKSTTAIEWMDKVLPLISIEWSMVYQILALMVNLFSIVWNS